MSWLDLFERDHERTFQPYEGTRLPTWWEWHRADVGLSVALLLAFGAILAVIIYRRPLRNWMITGLAAILRASRFCRRCLSGLRSEIEKRAAEK